VRPILEALAVMGPALVLAQLPRHSLKAIGITGAILAGAALGLWALSPVLISLGHISLILFFAVVNSLAFTSTQS